MESSEKTANTCRPSKSMRPMKQKRRKELRHISIQKPINYNIRILKFKVWLLIVCKTLSRTWAWETRRRAMFWVYRITRSSCKNLIHRRRPREKDNWDRTRLPIYIINTIKFISKLIITRMELDIYVNLKVSIAQSQHLNRSWTWITLLNVWTYSRFYKQKNTLSSKTSKMKKYNNFSNYKRNKSSQVKTTQSNSWTSYNENKAQTKKESSPSTSTNKSNFKTLRIFSNLRLYKNNNLTIRKHLEYSRWMNWHNLKVWVIKIKNRFCSIICNKESLKIWKVIWKR